MHMNQNPIQVTIPRPERSSRLLALATLLAVFKPLFLIPHLIILWVLGIVALVFAVIGQFAVLFTGSYPAGLHEFVVGYFRWQMRVNAYAFGLRDEYPPFTFKP